MYGKDGDFGLVKVKSHSFISEENLFTFTNCGWHKCNEKYRIDRDKETYGIIFVTVQGEGALEIDGTRYRLKKNTIAFVPKGKRVCYYTPKDGLWEFYWLHPKGKMCDALLAEIETRGVFINKIAATKNYCDIIEDILKLSDSRSVKTDIEISMKIAEFLHLCRIDLLIKEEVLSISERAMAYISEHKNENITVESCARALFISPSHLIREFKKEKGITPHKYLMDERLKEADMFLSLSTLSVKQVAFLTGFSSSAHLITAYKKHFGRTPKKENKNT